MYTLYFLPNACSLATQVVLRELNQDFQLVDQRTTGDFTAINPVGAVPVLGDGEKTMTEGAAIILHLLEQHPGQLLPSAPHARRRAIEQLLFANATMHPAYGRLFFIEQQLPQSEKAAAFEAATAAINQLWLVAAKRLGDSDFLGGAKVSPADILLAVYARWGSNFPVTIEIPANVTAMLDRVYALESFKQSLGAEQEAANEAAH